MNNINIDKTIEYVENIVHNNQCSVCAKTDGQRLRYSCGHTACDDCVVDVIDCSICLTPPQVSSLQPRLDDVLTQRVKNASILIRECQQLFNTYAYTRKRLSEQLRIEKELFPECIQAPFKYENKRKSSFNLSKNKENTHSFLPGEAISHLDKDNTMENSFKYVQQWLNKNDNDFVRKPFRDLNVNTQLDHNVKHSSNQYKTQNKFDKILSVSKTNRKRTHYKTTVSNKSFISPKRKSAVHQDYISPKKIRKEQPPPTTTALRHETNKEHDNDESGIFMDNDPIVIDDSQETAIDKDRNAWLAVLEANEHEQNESTSLVRLDCSDPQLILKEIAITSEGKQSRTNQNVPFYKKSYITETCSICNADKKTTAQTEDVKITIDNADFTATIKILNSADNGSKPKAKNSVSVQTDFFETINGDDSAVANLNDTNDKLEDVAQKSDIQSEDLFGDEEKHNENDRPSHDYKCLVIAESDSDMELEKSGPLPVKVDVHRSCDETDYGILSEIENIQEHSNRSRRGPRGLTPTSTDSSEKENFNPNRMKTQTNKKKKYSKKI